MEEKQEMDKNINAYLPVDLLVRIFLLFPFKSVLRLKSVCKVWNTIIRDQDFANMHWDNAHAGEPSVGILICHYSACNSTKGTIRTVEFNNGVTYGIVTIRHDVHFSCLELGGGLKHLFTVSDVEAPPGELQISTSINGLICLASNGSVTSVRVCNPWTRDFITLPALPADPNMRSRRVVLQGFGYSPSTKEYKVVGYVYFNSCIGKAIAIETLEPRKYVAITLGSPAWRVLECNIQHRYPFMHNAISTITGHIYWIAENGTCSEHVIVAMNVETEEFITIDTPPQALEGSFHHLRLAKLQQRLCLINGLDSTENYKGKSLDLKIWMLQESNREWIMKHRIVVHSVKYAGAKFIEFLYIHKGKLVFKSCLEGTTWLSFDIATGNLESIFEGEMNFVHPPYTTPFEESLTSLPSKYL